MVHWPVSAWLVRLWRCKVKANWQQFSFEAKTYRLWILQRWKQQTLICRKAFMVDIYCTIWWGVTSCQNARLWFCLKNIILLVKIKQNSEGWILKKWWRILTYVKLKAPAGFFSISNSFSYLFLNLDKIGNLLAFCNFILCSLYMI